MQPASKLLRQLENRKANNSLRSLTVVDGLTDFSSNDYLGLARDKSLSQMISEETKLARNGATGSRLLTGNSALAESVEQFVAQRFSSQKALIFNSGYSANLSVLSSIPQRNDVIFYDELCHASIKDGIRLSLAKKLSFKHNDLSELARKLKNQSSGEKYVVVESIYSMDGDACDLASIVKICRENQAFLIVDEAHATGLLGKHGGGLSEQLNLQDQIFCRIYTFGKAVGVHGSAVLGSEDLINYIINFARPFIYTTALPDHSYKAIKKALEFLSDNLHLHKKVEELTAIFIDQFNLKLKGKFQRTLSSHPIQTILVKGNDNARKLSAHIQQQGFDVRAILSPTVKEGEERLRICIHSFNTPNEISALVDTLAAYK